MDRENGANMIARHELSRFAFGMLLFTVGAAPSANHIIRENDMDAVPPPLVAQEIQIVDRQGKLRLLLSAKSGSPVIEMRQVNGAPSVEVTLDTAGRPAVRLSNPDVGAPTAALEVDDKGAHVTFNRPGGASSYLFLNNAGASGVALLDTKGVRRFAALVAPDGTAEIERFGPDGKPLP
jgi:hypothetical protein